MTREQEKMLLRKLDNATAKNIPKSARWHMQHKPYGIGESDTDGDKSNQEAAGQLPEDKK